MILAATLHYSLLSTVCTQERKCCYGSNGLQINAIERKRHEVAKEINLEILQKWTEGNGKKPVACETLVNV